MGHMAESSGNGGQRPGQGRLAAGANTPMAKTLALVVVALIVGIVLINIVGNGGSTSKTLKPTTTTSSSTTQPGGSTTTARGATTTTKSSTALVTPSKLQLIVVNSGAPTGSGGPISNALRARGYTKQTTTKKVTWKESGLTVHCKPGLERERDAIVAVLNAARIPHYPASAHTWKSEPGIASTEQCYVAIGAVA